MLSASSVVSTRQIFYHSVVLGSTTIPDLIHPNYITPRAQTRDIEGNLVMAQQGNYYKTHQLNVNTVQEKVVFRWTSLAQDLVECTREHELLLLTLKQVLTNPDWYCLVAFHNSSCMLLKDHHIDGTHIHIVIKSNISQLSRHQKFRELSRAVKKMDAYCIVRHISGNHLGMIASLVRDPEKYFLGTNDQTMLDEYNKMDREEDFQVPYFELDEAECEPLVRDWENLPPPTKRTGVLAPVPRQTACNFRKMYELEMNKAIDKANHSDDDGGYVPADMPGPAIIETKPSISRSPVIELSSGVATVPRKTEYNSRKRYELDTKKAIDKVWENLSPPTKRTGVVVTVPRKIEYNSGNRYELDMKKAITKANKSINEAVYVPTVMPGPSIIETKTKTSISRSPIIELSSGDELPQLPPPRRPGRRRFPLQFPRGATRKENGKRTVTAPVTVITTTPPIDRPREAYDGDIETARWFDYVPTEPSETLGDSELPAETADLLMTSYSPLDSSHMSSGVACDGDSGYEPDPVPVTHRCTSVTFSRNSRQVVVADKSGDAYVFDVQQQRERYLSETAAGATDDPTISGGPDTPSEGHCGGWLLLGHHSMLLNVLTVDSDRLVVTSDRDEKIRISHYPDGYNIQAYCLGHTQFVISLAYDEHRKWLISASGDATVRVWTLTGQELCCKSVLSDIPTDAALSADSESNRQDASPSVGEGREKSRIAIQQICYCSDCQVLFVAIYKSPDILVYRLLHTDNSDNLTLEFNSMLSGEGHVASMCVGRCVLWVVRQGAEQLGVAAFRVEKHHDVVKLQPVSEDEHSEFAVLKAISSQPDLLKVPAHPLDLIPTLWKTPFHDDFKYESNPKRHHHNGSKKPSKKQKRLKQ